MSWRDQLIQTSFLRNGQSAQAVGGSFRGIPFRTVDAELRVGRRNVVHEYPLRDDPFVEDLGRRARSFQVDCYVLGDDYLADRDELLRALETPGPGELIHPRWGSVWVSVQDVASVKESPSQGGIARFSITFVECGPNIFPNALADTTIEVEQTAAAADTAAAAAYSSAVDVTGPQVLADTAVRAHSKGLEALLATARRVTNTAGLASIVRDIALLSGKLTALIRTPTVLVQDLLVLQQQLVSEVLRPLAAIAEFRSVFFGNQRPGSVAVLAGSTRARAVVNAIAHQDLQRRIALTQQARLITVAISDGAVATAPQATALRDNLLAQIDQELETTDPDAATAQALGSLRSAVTRDVATRAELLRQRSTVRTQALLPALVLAHTVYQDAGRADELVARNGVRNPNFVPAGQLEVLL